MEISNQQHLFSENEYLPVQASTGKRFANYIIDVIFFYLLAIVTGIVMGMLNPEVALEEDSSSDLKYNLIAILLFFVYYFGFEAAFKGKTIGKFLTGTRAVNRDGSNISVNTALLRGLSRLVPFEPFSALGSPSHPWHDSWTKTYVIDEKASNRPQEV